MCAAERVVNQVDGDVFGGAGIPGLRLSESILIETMTLREPSGVTPLRVWKPWMSPPWDQ